MLSIISQPVNAATTSDPNHKGWSGKHPDSKQITWKPITTKCEQCTKITQQYNETVQELLNSRYWVNLWRSVQKNREKGKKDPFWPGKGDISEFESKAVGANLDLIEYQSGQLELHRKAVLMLEQQAQYLLQAVKDCERTACPDQKPSKQKNIKIGGERTDAPYQPDYSAILSDFGIDWKGPYSSKCLPCQPIVVQLNAVPDWIARAQMRLQRAEVLLKHSEYVDKANRNTLDFLKYSHPDQSDYSDLDAQIKQIKKEINALNTLFNNLLKQLAECEAKYCPNTNSDTALYLPAGIVTPLSTCPAPAANEAINVGANNDVGSSANFREKAKKKAAGMAAKAITGLLGIGGGGGGKSDGPNTYKDPVKNKQKLKVKHKEQKREIRLGGVFTPDGLLVSSDIRKAPGKGTFQTIYLQNPRGWQLMPIRLFMYEIWRDWKLNVSWTRDTYVDGQLVKHEEGGWSESWRELIASGEEVKYAEVPIWEQLGFNTAVSGARSLGTLFPLSPQMLAYEPVNLVVHITDPKKDPVVTVPYVFRVSLAGGKVVIEQVEETTVANSPVCTEGGATVVATTPVSEEPGQGPATTTEQPIGTPTGTPTSTTPVEKRLNYCPNGWACLLGKQCPPIENCTLPGSEMQPPAVNAPPGNQTVTQEPEDEIEDIIVTGTRIKTTEQPAPVTVNDGSSTQTPDNGIDEIEEIDVTGSRIKITTPQPPAVPTDTTTHAPPVTELEEIIVTGTRLGSSTELKYQDFSTGYRDLGLKVGLRYDYGGYTLPPITHGEEIDEPEVVGIVLKNTDRRWVPKHKNYTWVVAKLYVPESPGSRRWIPHDTVKRRMEIRFIDRSNETGKAMNAMLDSDPQNSPDLFFNSKRNRRTDCSGDSSGKGHYGVCITKGEHNTFTFYIDSDDYGGFSRLDVFCPGCVPLTPVAGVFPESFTPNQLWEVAVEERDREKRAVYVPHDSNKNQVSDGYPPDQSSFKPASDDSENAPMGNGSKGDGLSAYEEYRGFIDRWGLHVRADWDKKTLIIENKDAATTSLFKTASGLDVIEVDDKGHKNRIVNFNSGHANNVDQHGLLLQVDPSLEDKYAGYCDCDLERPKTSERVRVKPKYKHKPTVAHELGHAIGMHHHGEEDWPDPESIRAMTGGIGDLLPGRVHSGPTLCGTALPAKFRVGTKGDQASGHYQCIMAYPYTGYVYEQDGGDYDCMPTMTRKLFDNSAVGVGPNRMDRTAADASEGNCMSQIWISSE